MDTYPGASSPSPAPESESKDSGKFLGMKWWIWFIICVVVSVIGAFFLV